MKHIFKELNNNTKNYLQSKLEKHKKSTKKIKDDEFGIPEKYVENLFEYNYTLKQLKIIGKHYDINTTGNKEIVFLNIYSDFFLSNKIIKIQKMYRGHLIRRINRLKGIGLINREICVNQEDIALFIDIKELDYYSFFSYTCKQDDKEYTYGFDMNTFDMILKTKCNNPYNRTPISTRNQNRFKRLKKLMKLQKFEWERKDETPVKKQLTITERAKVTFNIIDELGNYSDTNWFLSLSTQKLIKFLRELSDIWNYRANLTPDVKQNISPRGDPFHNLNYIEDQRTHLNLQNIVLDVCDKMIMYGRDRSYQSLGALYVLSTLTLVNEDAAESLPWLYESVSLL
jgi:hypothetical protein